MKYIISIILLGIGLAVLAGGFFLPQYKNEILIGMLAPLLVSIFSIYLNKSTFIRHPEKLTSTLIKSFIFKMVLYALFFIVVLSIYDFEPNPFIISFTGFFILFYVIEAVFLQKLIQSDNK